MTGVDEGGSKNGDTNNHKFIKYNIALVAREWGKSRHSTVENLKNFYSFIIVCIFNLIYEKNPALFDTHIFGGGDEKVFKFSDNTQRRMKANKKNVNWDCLKRFFLLSF